MAEMFKTYQQRKLPDVLAFQWQGDGHCPELVVSRSSPEDEQKASMPSWWPANKIAHGCGRLRMSNRKTCRYTDVLVGGWIVQPDPSRQVFKAMSDSAFRKIYQVE